MTKTIAISNEVADSPDQKSRLIAMGQMAATLAHEIRNPLCSMELYCSLLKRDLKELPELQVLAAKVHSGIRNLERIIANCLQFSREIIPKFQTIEKSERWVKEAVEELRPKVGTEKVLIDVICDINSNSSVTSDPYLLSQVLRNLLENACDACKEKPEGQICVRSILEPKTWRLLVIDNGAGIPQEALGKIFDPFFTTKDSGTGLGLSIVHGIVSALGGELKIESKEGFGTTAQVILPRNYTTEQSETYRNDKLNCVMGK